MSSNMLDYLRWRGDITLEERTFNDVDNVILAMLSYFDFTGIVPPEGSDDSIRLSHACRLLLSKSGGDVSGYVRSFANLDKDFIVLLMESPRFRGSILSNYADSFDKNQALQFSALQIELPSDDVYISYRGTDNTLVGWREDFMTSFEVTEAQRKALGYLNRALGRLAERDVRIRVGGHSKGGNLAEYATTCCDDGLRKKIVDVYTNDGPGMAPRVMPHDSRAVLGKRLHRIMPTYSVVGMLFVKPFEPRTIVLSSAMGIAQHDAVTWEVKRNSLRTTADLLPDCKVVDEAIASWADNVGLAERKRITNEMFDALGASGAVEFEDIFKSKESMKKVFKALMNADERTKKVGTALLKSTFNSSVGAVRSATDEAFDSWSKNLASSFEEGLRKLFT